MRLDVQNKNIMKTIITIIASFFLLAGCGEKPIPKPKPTKLNVPTNVSVEQTGAQEATLTWTDTNDSEQGYAIYLINAANIDAPNLIHTTQANATSYKFTGGLEYNVSYYFGVQAKAVTNEYDSSIAKTKTPFKLTNPDDPDGPDGPDDPDNPIDPDDPPVPGPTMEILSMTSYSTGIYFTFKPSETPSGAEFGIAWSETGTPSIKGTYQVSATPIEGNTYYQMISNAMLDYGKTYSFSAYAKVNGYAYYSPVKTASLKDALAPITLEWTKQSYTGLHEDIQVYKTTSTLNGRAFNAWYAIADIKKGNVEFKTLVPSSLATVDAQAAAQPKCEVLVNAGFFYNGRHIGLAVVDGVEQGSINPARGSLRSDSPEYNVMYNITRGTFGVDANSNPGAYWATAGAMGSFYYDRPLPNIIGKVKYPAASPTNPGKPVSWAPKYALSAGPLLLINGKCPIDYTTTGQGSEYWLTNYDMTAYDIYRETPRPDRTAVGYTADGKVILFICDGRITASGGASLVELAQIMKGIGCVGAVNFDGGGSTGMVVKGQHINDMTGGNRTVSSTMGFFTK